GIIETNEEDPLTFRVRGKSRLLDLDDDLAYQSYGRIPITIYGMQVYVLVRTLSIAGGWTLVGGSQGNGDYRGEIAVFILDDEDFSEISGLELGHIVGIVPSYLWPSGFTMDGKWKQ
ncbi:MAG TPA: hypothetical protein VMW13_02195, partial [Dehalococcoidales bacterium]|nr:hypothetical protein [Dehalococcoidales bacterium]